MRESITRTSEAVDPDFRFAISYADNVIHETNDIEELIRDTNPANRPITQITLEAASRREKYGPEDRNVMVRLRGTSSLSGVSLSIKGPSPDWVRRAADSVGDALSAARLGYSLRHCRFVESALTHSPWAIAAAVLVLGGLEAFLDWRLSVRALSYLLLVALSGAIVATLLGLKSETLARAWLPPVVFRIGAGEERWQMACAHRRQVKWGLFVALLVGVVASLIASYIHHPG